MPPLILLLLWGGGWIWLLIWLLVLGVACLGIYAWLRYGAPAQRLADPERFVVNVLRNGVQVWLVGVGIAAAYFFLRFAFFLVPLCLLGIVCSLLLYNEHDPTSTTNPHHGNLHVTALTNQRGERI